jgi:hypothetical protein
MGNTSKNDMENKYDDIYTSLNITEIEKIRQNYKIVEVDWLDKIVVNKTIYYDKYFIKNPIKKEVINNMVDYYLNHEHKDIYKKTDYLCNEKEKICICNIHAEELRKLYDRDSYPNNTKYISWCKIKKEHF